MTRINIELEDEVHKKAKVVCAMKDTTLIKYINDALKERVKKDGR